MNKPRIVQKIIYPDGEHGYAHYNLSTRDMTVTKGEDEPRWDLTREDTFEVPFVGISERMEEAYLEMDLDLYNPKNQN